MAVKFPSREETWRGYARRVTERLKGVRVGDRLQNTQSKITGVAIGNIDREHPYIPVRYIRFHRRGEKRVREERKTAWSVENIRIVR